MGQAPFLVKAVYIGLEAEDVGLGLLVIPVNGGAALPEGLIKLDLSEDVEGVVYGQAHLVEGPELVHALSEVLGIFRVANSHVVEVGRDLVAVFRIDIDRVVAQSLAADGGEHGCLLLAVDQLVCSFAGDPHDVFRSAGAE